MALNAGELQATLSLDDDKFNRGIDKAGSKTSAFAGIAKNAGLVVGGAMVTAGAAAIGFGIQTASANEQAKVSFTTMLGSAEKADAMIKDMKAFAAKTPFEFKDIQNAASSLISVGVESSKVIPMMTTLGNVTAGMGTGSEGVKRATIALQQMSAAGRITGEDLNQLRDAGVPVFDLLAGATGKSKEEVANLAQAGKLGKKEMEAMFTALETGKGLEKFNGLMEEQSKTLAGKWSTIKDTFAQGTADLITPALPALKAGMDQVATIMQLTFGDIKIAGEIVSDFFKGFEGKSQGIGQAAEAGKDFKQTFDEIANTISTTLAPLIDQVVGVFNQISGSITSWISENQSTISAWSQTLSEIFNTVIEVLTLAWEAITGIFSFAVGFISDMWTRFGQHLLDNMAQAINGVLNVIQGVLEVIKGIFNVFIGVFTGDWSRAWDGVKQIFSGIWQAITGIFSAVWESIKTTFNLGLAFVQTIWASVWGWVKREAIQAWEGIKSTVSGGFKTIVDTAKALPGNIAGAVSGAWESLKNGFKEAINWIIKRWNNLSFTTPKIHIPGTDKDVGGDKISVPQIPLLAKGGHITAAGMAIVGERGPELVQLPRAASVIPLTQSGGGGVQTGLTIEKIEINGVQDGNGLLAVLPELQAAIIAGVRRAG